MSAGPNWKKINQELVAKAIGELHFEEVIKATPFKDGWSLNLSSGVTYTFKAQETIWTYLKVRPESLFRDGKEVISAADFFLDSLQETGMSEITLGNFFEEMNNTLYGDLILKEKNFSADELAHQTGEVLQLALSGHPKILLNKGRLGWGEKEFREYAPESRQSFQLHWIALEAQKDEKLIDFTHDAFEGKEKNDFLALLKNRLPHSQFHIIPVHPWQWNRIISIQFRQMIEEDKMIYLGEGGDFFRPQISIRTLSNLNHPLKPDIKLPLSILNTSCVRGLTAATIESGQKVSQLLHDICHSDKTLREMGTEILLELKGVALVQKDFKKVQNAPYRYHEYLGAISRESAQSKLSPNEKGIITAALFHQDQEGKPLISRYIELSGLSKEEWLKEYFKRVVIPLYHLQVEYGIGLVSHGQNIVLKLTDFKPSGMFLKDFQGDLRLSSELPEKTKTAFKEVEASLTKLPANYLIHDLVTGHFVTVLRFISAALLESEGYQEAKFYELLSEEIQSYLKNRKIIKEQDILRPELERVLLNKVRFKIGYSDSAERPLPLTGSLLKNPLFPGNKL